MKKLFSTLLTLVFILSFGSVALANEPTYTDDPNVTITKVVEITNKGTTNPEEDFEFNIGTGSGLRDGIKVDAPAFKSTKFNIKVDPVTNTSEEIATSTATATINLPNFENVGVYTYPLKEAPGNTAGMTYDENSYELVITVINNPKYQIVTDAPKFLRLITLKEGKGKKVDDFVNTYNAGSLEVSKTVTGNLGDKEKYFEVKVTLNAPEGLDVNSTIGISGGTYTNPSTIQVGTETSIWLKHGETITFTNVPYGVTYTVVEEDYTGEGYNAPVYLKSDEPINSALDTVTITNNKEKGVDTGISLDSIPYILILGFAVLGISGLFLKRRKNTNF